MTTLASDPSDWGIEGNMGSIPLSRKTYVLHRAECTNTTFVQIHPVLAMYSALLPTHYKGNGITD